MIIYLSTSLTYFLLLYKLFINDTSRKPQFILYILLSLMHIVLIFVNLHYDVTDVNSGPDVLIAINYVVVLGTLLTCIILFNRRKNKMSMTENIKKVISSFNLRKK